MAGKRSFRRTGQPASPHAHQSALVSTFVRLPCPLTAKENHKDHIEPMAGDGEMRMIWKRVCVYLLHANFLIPSTNVGRLGLSFVDIAPGGRRAPGPERTFWWARRAFVLKALLKPVTVD